MSVCRVDVLNMIFLLTLLGSFFEPGAMQIEVQPGDTILMLNQMSNATFHCTCNECSLPPYWSLENEGRHFSTDNANDRMILAEQGITYSSSGTSAVITIPDTMENNNTQISCAVFIFGSIEFSDPPVKVTIIGPPLPPEPILVINNSSQLKIQWQIPYSHENFGIESYNIQIVNMSSGNVLDSVLNYNDISYVFTFENDVQYCQILTVNVTAVSALGPSVPGSVSGGFPIVPRPFQSGGVDVEVTFQDNENPVATISFVAPLICDYQTANYTLTIEDITDSELLPLTRESAYSGSNRSIVEMFTTGLQINHNYTLSISVVGEDFNTEISTALNFSSLIHTSHTVTEYVTTLFEQTNPDAAGCYNSLSLRAALMCLLVVLFMPYY